ncbi:hypothetical protein QPK32_01235 [Massilia sp. YIM B02763]|uniref:hypothetical protein n=1 Tax=Massilia sp. YIM B02763 TaxID=3050130 RepID=UPI0025B68356|nr:hypothetical protein [Massilia sp. YIM B02763]MDN4051707.1 hypothetical protein [Massilia sp. YIM B02763]
MSKDNRQDQQQDNQQDNQQSGNGNHQQATSGIHSNFAHASPESNVNPPGKPLNSHGSAVEPVAGGTEGGFEASRNAQQATLDGDSTNYAPGSRQGTEASDEQTLQPANADQDQSRRDS